MSVRELAARKLLLRKRRGIKGDSIMLLLTAAFLRATALVIAGYFVWFASSRSEDRLKAAGKYIAIWCFAFAGVLVIAGIAGAFMHAQGRGFHGRPAMMMHRGMMPGEMMDGDMMRRPRFMFRDHIFHDRAPEPKADTPAPAAPAPPAPKS